MLKRPSRSFATALLSTGAHGLSGSLCRLGTHALPDALPGLEALDSVRAHHFGEDDTGGVHVRPGIQRLPAACSGAM